MAMACLSIELLRAITEGIDQGIGRLIEQGAKRGLDQRPGIIERQVQADLASLLPKRLEFPDTVQVAEWPLLQTHLDTLARLQLVTSQKALTHPRFRHGHAGL